MVSTHALVTHAPENGSKDPVFNMEELDVDEPGEYELLVQMVATGICHSDIYYALHSIDSRTVLGHEGAGRVLKTGSKVTTVSIGDPILLSFHACNKCPNCLSGHPALCPEGRKHRSADQPRFTHKVTSERVNGLFFGQSSFAQIALVREASVIPAEPLLSDPSSNEELQLFAPLGCGFMTGAGTVVNIAKAGPNTEIMVTGLGGVGLGALMAAKVAGCKTILAVDRVDSRLQLAKELGATHTLNTSNCKDLTSELKDFAQKASTEGYGINIAIDTTAYMPLVEAGIETLAPGGQLILVGISLPTAEITVRPLNLLGRGLTLRASLLGDALPQKFVPKMVEWYRRGEFPIEKLVKFFKAEDVDEAVRAMHDGSTVKPVLLW